jgi:DNA-binding response OmpR family regulator
MDRKPRILVVDDDLPILTLMRNVLKEFDFEPMVASSGDEALTRARQNAPDLILLDLNMPDMSGRDLADALRSEPSMSDVPILILSGEPMRRPDIDAIGAAGAVLKPFELEDLISQIRSHVARRVQANRER